MGKGYKLEETTEKPSHQLTQLSMFPGGWMPESVEHSEAEVGTASPDQELVSWKAGQVLGVFSPPSFTPSHFIFLLFAHHWLSSPLHGWDRGTVYDVGNRIVPRAQVPGDKCQGTRLKGTTPALQSIVRTYKSRTKTLGVKTGWGKYSSCLGGKLASLVMRGQSDGDFPGKHQMNPIVQVPSANRLLRNVFI